MKFVLRVESDDADMADEPNEAMYGILRRLAGRVRYGAAGDSGVVLDVNGNRVGEWEMQP